MHLLGIALLFALAVHNVIEHSSLPIPLTGDYIMVAVSGLVLVVFGWNFYTHRF